jgi:hypothetical protein
MSANILFFITFVIMLVVLGVCGYLLDEKPNKAFIIAIVMLSVTVFVSIFVATDLFHSNPKTERYAIQNVSFEHNRVSVKVADRHGHEHTESYTAHQHGCKIVPEEVEKKPYLLKKTYHVGPIYQRILEYHVSTIDLSEDSQ